MVRAEASLQASVTRCVAGIAVGRSVGRSCAGGGVSGGVRLAGGCARLGVAEVRCAWAGAEWDCEAQWGLLRTRCAWPGVDRVGRASEGVGPWSAGRSVVCARLRGCGGAGDGRALGPCGSMRWMLMHARC